MRAFGHELPEEILGGEELHTLEPALAHAVDAGFLIRQHWHVRPETFAAGLAATLRRMGVEIVEGAEVIDFDLTGRRVTGLRSAAGGYAADAVVLAAGAWTRPLAGMLGVRLPLEAGKGYTFLVTPWSCRVTRSCSRTRTSHARRSASSCGSAGRWSSAA